MRESTRPVFVPHLHPPCVKAVPVKFKNGRVHNQDQLGLLESIEEWHNEAAALGIGPVVEISTAVKDVPKEVIKRRRSRYSWARHNYNMDLEFLMGVSLSAVNLEFTTPKGQVISVESAYQGSKVFKYGGPYHDLYDVPPLTAKKDKRLRSSGRLIGFNFFGENFSPEPKTAFYNWLYLSALTRNKWINKLDNFEGFTDVYFSPRAVNCQARACAVAISLESMGLLFTKEGYFRFIDDREKFYHLMRGDERIQDGEDLSVINQRGF